MSEKLSGTVDAFLEQLRVVRKASEHTVRAYARDLSDFVAFLEAEGVTEWQQVTVLTLRQYLNWLFAQGYERRSIARKLSSVRSFFRFLARMGYISVNPALDLKQPRLPQKLPMVLEVSEVERLLSSPDTSTPRGLRDRAILELLYATGLRVSEVASLRISDIDFAEKLVRVKGKGGKERIALLHDEALNWLERYLTESRPLFLQRGKQVTDIVFVSQKGTPLTVRQIHRIVDGYAKKVLGRAVSPHALQPKFTPASHEPTSNEFTKRLTLAREFNSHGFAEIPSQKSQSSLTRICRSPSLFLNLSLYNFCL